MTLHNLMLYFALLGAVAMEENLKMRWKKCIMEYHPNQATLIGMVNIITLEFVQRQIKSKHQKI